MAPFQFASFADHEMRADIPEAYRTYWSRLAAPGSWWDGAERIAIAAHSRMALDCKFCVQRHTALSPYAVNGGHSGETYDLPDAAIDAVHRIVTDQTRISSRMVEELAQNGIHNGAYVELVGIVVTVLSIDEFHRALGLDLEPLPAPEAGSPDAYTPAHTVDSMGFVPTIPLEGAVGNEADLWNPKGRAPNVLRALTLVPNALRHWRDVAAAQYLSFEGMANFVKDPNRVIDRKQMELIAGRVSAINECFY